jgi:hypothetical protein
MVGETVVICMTESTILAISNAKVFRIQFLLKENGIGFFLEGICNLDVVKT